MSAFLRERGLPAVCGAVLGAIGMAAPAVAETLLSSGQPLEGQEKYYGVSCIAETNDPTVLIAPSLDKPIEGGIGFDPTFSFLVDGFVYADNEQFLRGMMANRAGRLISKGIEFQGPDRNELFVLASQWDCALYRGLMPWPAHRK